MSLEDLEKALAPCERHLNPGHGHYGQSVMIDGQCHIATGRKGEMTDYYEHKIPAYDLGTDHKCKCVEWSCCADAQTDVVKLGGGLDTIGHLDASIRIVNIIPEDGTQYIEFQYNGISSSNISETPPDYVYTIWFKPKEEIANGHYEVNLWEHLETKDDDEYGIKISLSSDDTNNDGALSVAISNESGSRSVYTTTKNTWDAGTRYHVGVVQEGTSLKVYIDNEIELSTSTVAIASAEAKFKLSTTQSTTTPYPLLVECITYSPNVPDDAEEVVKQRFNKTANPPKTKPGVKTLITPGAYGRGCPSPYGYSAWYGVGYTNAGMPELPGNEEREAIPFSKYTNRWHMIWHAHHESDAAKYWREVDTVTNDYFNYGWNGVGGNGKLYSNGPKKATLITKDGKLIAHTYAYSAGVAHSAQSYPTDTYVVLDYDSRGRYNNRPMSWQIKPWLYGSMLGVGHIQGLEPM